MSEWISTPKVPGFFPVVIREEPSPYTKTGKVFRAYHEDGTPTYIGRETREELLRIITEDHPEMKVKDLV